MISNEPRFVTPSDFENYWGIDLKAKFKDTNNLSNNVNMFLKQVEDEIIAHIDARTNRIYLWDRLTPYQREHMEKAILIQALYEFQNGKIGMDSGFDPERGFLATQDQLASATICRQCIEELKAGALYNQNVKNHRRYTRFY